MRKVSDCIPEEEEENGDSHEPNMATYVEDSKDVQIGDRYEAPVTINKIVLWNKSTDNVAVSRNKVASDSGINSRKLKRNCLVGSLLAFLMFLISIMIYVMASPHLSTTGELKLPGANLTDQCLNCICKATNCIASDSCSSIFCGPFSIGRDYWSDAGRFTLEGNVSDNNYEDYLGCVLNFECAKETVRGYMSHYAKDCNEDSVVNCLDYALLHHLGAGCEHDPNPAYIGNIKYCISSFTEDDT